jgi:transcriptional regulator with XRE-family HTH domain
VIRTGLGEVNPGVDIRCRMVGVVLRRRRIAKRLTQDLVSAVAGLRQGQLSLIESGAVEIRMSQLFGAASALEVQACTIIREAEALERQYWLKWKDKA